MLKNIMLLAITLLAVTSCVDKEPNYGNFPTKDVDFSYQVDGDEYQLDFYVVSTVQFTNTSSKKGNVTWDFGDGNLYRKQPQAQIRQGGHLQCDAQCARRGLQNLSLDDLRHCSRAERDQPIRTRGGHQRCASELGH